MFTVFGRQQLGFVQLKPGVDAFFLNEQGNFFQQRGGIGVQLAGFFVGEEGHRRAPETLAAHHPVGAAFNHGFQPRASPGGEEFGVVHGFEGFVAQGFAVCAGFVHADEPLAGGAVNQRGFVPPAVGVAVFDFAVGEQAVVFLQPVDNRLVGFPHGHAGQARHFGDIAALSVHGVIELDAVFVADEIVFQTVRGRGVHETGTGFGGYVVAIQNENIAFDKGMFGFQVFQICAGAFGEDGAT